MTTPHSIGQFSNSSKDLPPAKKSKLVPAASFADVLQQLGESDADPSGESTQRNPSWGRPSLPRIHEEKHSITFQITDIFEGHDEHGKSEIQLFGVTKAGHSVLVHVSGFDSYFYYPAPTGFTCTDLEPLKAYLNSSLGPGDSRDSVTQIELEECALKPGGNAVPFLQIFLYDFKQMRRIRDESDSSNFLYPRLRTPLHFFTSGTCEYRDLFDSPEHSYEADIPYALRFTIDSKISPLSWIKLQPAKYKVLTTSSRETNCQLEISTIYDHLEICEVVEGQHKCAPLRILSFDLECNVRAGHFPNPKYDPVFQIANMVTSYGQATPFVRNVFTLDTCAPIAGTQVLSHVTEEEMLKAWHKFFLEVDPDIIIGYNITQFDMQYLLKRASLLGIREFACLGKIKTWRQPIITRPRFDTCPGYAGRLVLDVYHHIREHHPGLKGDGAYKLNNIAFHFLKERKEDIDYEQIPLHQNGNADTRRDLAIYCLKDVYLPLLLFDKLKCFEKEVSLAKAACIPFNTLRLDRPLREKAIQYMDAFEKGFVVADKESRMR